MNSLRPSTHFRPRTAAAGVLLALAFASASPAPAHAQDRPAAAEQNASRSERDSAALRGVQRASEAPVRPGDRIRLVVWREEDWSGEFSVDERGEVVLPRLGPVRVSHLAAGELRDTLRTRYAEFLRSPDVEVTVLRRVAIHGEVHQPTLYWVDLTMSLRDAIALAGGVNPYGNADRIIVERDGERMRFSESEGEELTLLEAGLRSGDRIFVERRSWVALNAPFVISTAVSVTSILAGFLLTR